MASIPARLRHERRWYEIWLDIWIHPGVDSFKSLLSEGDHDVARGIIWVGVSSLFVGILSFFYTINIIERQALPVSSGFASMGILGIAVTPFFYILVIVIRAGLFHWVAKVFHGRGEWKHLVICMAAISASSILLSGILLAINWAVIQMFPTSLVIPIILLLFSLYTLVLEVNGIRAAEEIGTGGAIGTIFLPALLIGGALFCISTLYILGSVK